MKFKKILVLLLVVMIAIFAFSKVFATDAQVVANDKNFAGDVSEIDTVVETFKSEDKYIDNDLFEMEDTIQISNKTIDGNAFLMAKTINASELTISGSLYVLAEEASLSNINVKGSLYILGQDLKIDGGTYSNIYSLGQTEKIDVGTGIMKNVYALVKDFNFGGNANNVYLSGETIIINSEAEIENLDVTSTSEPEIPSSVVKGNYNFYQEKESSDEIEIEKTFNVKNAIYSIFSYVLITLIIGFIISKVFPNFIEKIKEAGVEGMLSSTAGGLVIVILVPLLVISLFISGIMCGIGFRLSIILLLLYIVAFLISTPIGLVYIAKLILEKIGKTESKYFYLVLIGLAVIVGIIKEFTPISGVIQIVLGLLGLGSAIFVGLKKEKAKAE